MGTEWERNAADENGWEATARDALSKLQFNSRPLIGQLSRLAVERERAPRFVAIVESELERETRHGALCGPFSEAPGGCMGECRRTGLRPERAPYTEYDKTSCGIV